jgi:hypothetical protein
VASFRQDPPLAVRCPACGAGSHPAAAFCAVCGEALRRTSVVARAVAETVGGVGAWGTRAVPAPAPARATRPTRWEYQDVGIPVELYPLEAGFLEAFDQAMTTALIEYGREGWEPASPTDWQEIVAAGRYVPAMRPGPLPLVRFLGERPMVTEIVMRLRRPA